MGRKAKNKNLHYVDNEKFTNAVRDYVESCKVAEQKEEKRPVPNDYIGDCILKICTNLGYKYNFINYTYKDEMIFDGVLNCIKVIKNFNYEKSKNAFAYFTQIAYYAFVRRIKTEKKQQVIKYRKMLEFDVEDLSVEGLDKADAMRYNELISYLQEIGMMRISEYAKDKQKKDDLKKKELAKNARKPSGATLTDFLE